MWHILGAGAIGTLWASHLCQSGHKVTLILRNPQKLSHFLENSSIRIEANGAEQRFSLQAELADTSSTINQLLITTKTSETRAAIQSIKQRIAEDARIIILQNGMGNQQWLQESFPHADVVWGSTTDGAWLRDPFHVVHAGQGITRMGKPDGSECLWLEELKQGPLTLEADPEIELTLWRKLAVNCAINPLTALHQCRNGALCTHPDYHGEMIALCEEIETVIDALGLELFDKPLHKLAAEIAQITAENYSSMMQDVRNHRTTEIDAITGYLCRTAKALDITTPLNDSYWQKIKKTHESS